MYGSSRALTILHLRPETGWGRTASIERPPTCSARSTLAWRASLVTLSRMRTSVAQEDKQTDKQGPGREEQHQPQTKADDH